VKSPSSRSRHHAALALSSLDSSSSSQVAVKAAIASNDPSRLREELEKQVKWSLVSVSTKKRLLRMRIISVSCGLFTSVSCSWILVTCTKH